MAKMARKKTENPRVGGSIPSLGTGVGRRDPPGSMGVALRKTGRKKSAGPAGDALTALVNTAATTGSTALSVGASASASIAWAAGGAAGGGIAGMALNWLATRRRRRWERWIDGYVNAAPPIDLDEVEAHLHAKGDDPVVQEVVLEGVRAIDEALADVVVPALARLTRQYVADGRSADGFFRGVRRTLSDLTNEEFAALVSLLRRVATLDIASSAQEVELHYVPTENPHGYQLDYLRPLPKAERTKRGTVNEWALIGPQHCASRLFHLLKTNGLGRDGKSGTFGGSAGPHIIEISFDIVRRFLAVVE
jgi:hypothetical protein